MRALLSTTLVAALAAFGGARMTLGRTAPGPTEPESSAFTALAAELRALQSENTRMVRELERRAQGPQATPAQVRTFDDAEIAAALERWRAAHPMDTTTPVGTASPRHILTATGRDLAEIPIQELVQALASAEFTHDERQELFQKLREAGRMDEYVAAIEKLAEQDPDNADLQVALGHAYLQRLFEVGNSPEAGPLAMKSDAAFDRALELDEDNWGARFSKAVSLSNWPAFLGRGPEAIEHFEILLGQQAALPKRGEFALTYLFLGNMEQAAGDREAALQTWREGLQEFPDAQALRRAVELAENQTPPPTRRDAQR